MSGFAAGGRTHDVQVLTAVSAAGWDAQLVKTLEIAPGRIAVVRRCVDVAELLATVGAGIGQAVLLGEDMRHLDRETVSSLRRSRVGVIGVRPPGDTGVDARLSRLGVRHVVPVDIGPKELAETILQAVAEAGATTSPQQGDGRAKGTDTDATVRPDGVAREAEADADALAFVESSGQRGRLIAVWGPCGSPGRTTLAVNIAMESALLGLPTMLADADTYGASIAQVLGLLDEAPGLAGAARLANDGALDAISLARHARWVAPALHVLTGIPRAVRWPELRPAALETVYDEMRSVAATTVVDCGFCVEEDEALRFDTAAPQRNGATLATLQAADVVVVVGAGDPVGLARLVRGLSDLGEAVPEAVLTVVVNRVRGSVAGPDPTSQIGDALQRYAGIRNPVYVPDDPDALDAALAGGLSLAEAAPASGARQSIQALSRTLLGFEALAPRRGLFRLRR
ncbi:chromosome partitioning protein [Actinobacteria bacterium YIM 96077]|uniref:Chromosome partitioning protein n=1 Tax=Phytoactinopolyspora halophila TaxID=1981511 RepID=A0A329R2C3_9ACTN|nr:chromosome partitioning protein [Phytoactinopolyspora halophila]AYY12075.1 chromosome partitioning protein [Actinobacteria bacterium YIM 96077]RAW18691.1 chromosome partitioning protein [Phytoactinopolyspora halophila]